MRIVTRQERRLMLYGWAGWTPLLAVAFAPLFYDAWLNTQIRRLDYHKSTVAEQTRALHAEIERLRNEAAAREQLDLLAEAAPAMGLREPVPGQVEVIYYDAALDGAAGLPEPFVMAARGGKETLRAIGGFGIDPLAGLVPRLGMAAGEAEEPAEPLPGPVQLEALTPELLILEEIAPAAPAPAPEEAAAGSGERARRDKVAWLPRR